MKRTNGAPIGLLVIRLLLGVFLFFEGVNKISWFSDSGILANQLLGWRESAPTVSRWYLDTVAIPGDGLFAWLVPLGELGCGLALILGVYTPLVACLALLMVLNFHVASGALFEYGFLTNGYGLPVVGGLLGLTVGGSRLPLSVAWRKKK
jgi:uncharacterized membrane protein YphA (DoxX/SURF4 family)